jgi:NAD(P)-dependent dehydrogenase (short-subunit alcohol dehydrogenase family)
VTGAGKGLGRAFALHLADLGAAVVVNNRNREVDANGMGPADHVVAEIQYRGGRAIANYGDVCDPNTATDLIETALGEFGRLDICVTSAAISSPQPFHRTTPENLRSVLEINVVGTALVTAAAMAVMRKAGHGNIIMIASTAGLHGEPYVSAYAASKGAVIALGRTAAAEGADKGVRTNVLLPYATTQMTEAGMDPRYIDAMRAELVAPVVGALAHPECTLNGEVIVAAGTGLRSADSVEGGTVMLPAEDWLAPDELAAQVAKSRASATHTFPYAQAGFLHLAAEVVANS